MDLTKSERKIIATVDGLREEMIDFARRLVREPSTVGQEASVLEVMETELARLGWTPVRVAIDPARLAEHPGFAPVPWDYEGRYNVVAVEAAAAGGGRSALFNGHLDVVSPEPVDFWESDPFSAQVQDGWLCGRGAGDMKSGVAAMVHALNAVKQAGFGLRAPVTLEAVIEEECSGNGALACLADGYDAEAVLIPEPFGPTILTSQVGVLWFKVSVKGMPTHVLEAPAGTNAIEKCFQLIDALRRLEARLNREEAPAAYRELAHPLNLNIGIFRGGDWPSTVPAETEFHCRLSYFPGVRYEDFRRRIVDTLRQAAEADPWLRTNPPRIEFYGFRSDGHSVSRELPALQALNDCHRTLKGGEADEFAATCTTDLRAFHHFGQNQATCYGPVAEHIHGADERVRLDSVMDTARVYALFLARWCGLVD
jgi:acetylornithine deacetylase